MNTTSVARAMLAIAIVAGASACTPREDAVGPAQKAGQAIDNAGDEVARKIQDKLDKAEQAGEKAADAARATGDKLKDATGDASRGLEEATRNAGKKVEQAGEKIQDAAKPD
jgi:F0F1-type ATP synthase membrane subunit b/b'